MSQITSGKVLYGRTVQPAQYESKRVDVEIAFVIGEGEDYQAMLAVVANAAYGKCHEMLGLKASAANSSGVVVETAGPDAAAEKTAGKRGRKALPAVDPAAVDVVADPKPIEQKPAETKPAADPAAVEDWSGTPAEITDKELLDAITKKNNEIRNPAAIRTLIGKYAPPPKQAREIEQVKRQAFLAELDKLQKAA